MMDKTVTLVTGGNQGMGLEIVRELAHAGQRVIMGARSLERGQAAVDQLLQENLVVDLVQLDVSDTESIAKAVKYIDDTYGYLTILINNAGLVAEKHQLPTEVSIEAMQKDFEVNFFGLVQVTQQMVPLLLKKGPARIINISSMMGSHTAALMPGSEVYQADAVGYQASKSAANMFTIQLSKQFERAGQAVTVNAVDPGIVATNFGGTSAAVSKEHGAKSVTAGVARTIYLATADTIDTGTFTNVNGIVPW